MRVRGVALKGGSSRVRAKRKGGIWGTVVRVVEKYRQGSGSYVAAVTMAHPAAPLHFGTREACEWWRICCTNAVDMDQNRVKAVMRAVPKLEGAEADAAVAALLTAEVREALLWGTLSLHALMALTLDFMLFDIEPCAGCGAFR